MTTEAINARIKDLQDVRAHVILKRLTFYLGLKIRDLWKKREIQMRVEKERREQIRRDVAHDRRFEELERGGQPDQLR